MPRDYRKIIAWQRAHELTLTTYRLTQRFPKHEMFGLTSQLRRAAVGAGANIVEGASRDSIKEYLHFLHIAFGSSKEAEYLAMLAHDLRYLDDSQYAGLTESQDQAISTLYGLIKSVEKEAGMGQ
jgi:four helix bundle protein